MNPDNERIPEAVRFSLSKRFVLAQLLSVVHIISRKRRGAKAYMCFNLGGKFWSLQMHDVFQKNKSKVI